MPIDSELLRTFLAIAEAGNLTVAAAGLCRTQSAISVQLRKLETGLGAPLFYRTAKGMKLTQAGELLRPRAERILADLRATAMLFADPLRGSLRVGFPDDFDDHVLEHVLAQFRCAHPGVQVTAVSGCTSGYAGAIRGGTLDVAVCSGPDNDLGLPLGTERTAWAAKRGSTLHLRPEVPVAVLDRACWWRDLPLKALKSAGRDYGIAFVSRSFSSLQAALRAGVAVGVLPASCLGDDLVELTAEHGFPDLPVSHRSILVSEDAPPEPSAAMVTAIRDVKLGLAPHIAHVAE